MARKLKVFRTSVGFFDLAIAAPSMKAAAEAWGSDPDIFQRGFAEETDDPKVVKATMGKPGVVLRRPVGSTGEYNEKAELPKAPAAQRPPAPESKPKSEQTPAGSRTDAAAKSAAKEAKRREHERQKEEQRRERARQERERLIAAADAAFEKAKTRHNDAAENLARRRKELDRSETEEESLWEAEQRQHKSAIDSIPELP